LLDDKERRERMGAASLAFFKPGAAEIIAQEILRIAE
jgi:hypothetical protein